MGEFRAFVREGAQSSRLLFESKCETGTHACVASSDDKIDETRALPLSYGPEILEPPGFEPGTSCVQACSSIGIRRNLPNVVFRTSDAVAFKARSTFSNRGDKNEKTRLSTVVYYRWSFRLHKARSVDVVLSAFTPAYV
jgi:hypothetical protein